MKELNVDDIIRMYTIEEKSLKEISILLDVNDGTVRKRLVDNNIRIRSRSECKKLKDKTSPCSGNGRKYNLNFNYFKNWSRNMAYILGFIGADGYINKNNSFVRISLQRGDIDILDKIKNEIDFTGEVSKSTHRIGDMEYPTATLCIYSKYMVKDLIELGIVNSKSFTITMDKIPYEYRLDFIRGYFDGDGSVGEQWTKSSKIPMLRARICSGSEKLLRDMVNHLEELGVKRVNVRKDSRKELYNIEYSQNSSKRIYELFYDDKTLIFLDRKRNKFEEVLRKQKNTH